MVDGLLRRGFVHTLHSHRGREVQMERRELAAAAERGRSRSFTVISMNNEEGGRKIEQRKQVGSIRASEIKTERLGS